jgi:hypothetical protein
MLFADKKEYEFKISQEASITDLAGTTIINLFELRQETEFVTCRDSNVEVDLLKVKPDTNNKAVNAPAGRRWSKTQARKNSRHCRLRELTTRSLRAAFLCSERNNLEATDNGLVLGRPDSDPRSFKKLSVLIFNC